jgi:hypothetical protein
MKHVGVFIKIGNRIAVARSWIKREVGSYLFFKSFWGSNRGPHACYASVYY